MAVGHFTRPAGASLSRSSTEAKRKWRPRRRAGLHVGFDPVRDSAPVDIARGSGNAVGVEVRYGN